MNASDGKGVDALCDEGKIEAKSKMDSGTGRGAEEEAADQSEPGRRNPPVERGGGTDGGEGHTEGVHPRPGPAHV